MKFIDEKLGSLRLEVEALVEHCDDLGDQKTRQLLLEVHELLEITHSSFLGQSLNSIDAPIANKHQKH
jgi:hypothetical protein